MKKLWKEFKREMRMMFPDAPVECSRCGHPMRKDGRGEWFCIFARYTLQEIKERNIPLHVRGGEYWEQ